MKTFTNVKIENFTIFFPEVPYAKNLWDNNLIKTEIICEDDVKKIKFKSTCVRILKPEDNNFVDDTEEKTDEINDSKKLPWYKRIFEN